MHFLPSLFLLPYPTHHPVALEGEVERWTNLLYPKPPGGGGGGRPRMEAAGGRG